MMQIFDKILMGSGLSLSLLALLYIGTLTLPIAVDARMAASPGSMMFVPPAPPQDNPHPPQSEADKKRVAFAEHAVKTLLMADQPHSAPYLLQFPVTEKFKMTAACLDQPDCWKNASQLKNFINRLEQNSGRILELKHTHIIPWSFQRFENLNLKPTPSVAVDPHASHQSGGSLKSDKEHSEMAAPVAMPTPTVLNDEFLIHIYVKTQNGKWHHLDVILHEAGSQLELRGFFITPILPPQQSLPDGVVC